MADNKTPGAGAPKVFLINCWKKLAPPASLKISRNKKNPHRKILPRGEEKKPGEGAPNAEKKEGETEKPAAAADDDIPR
jgi:hypothetical protein